jgi:glyceraldehyde-3-phosphate dehydrogenase/erythrose-4-phosphate dehydrogenase
MSKIKIITEKISIPELKKIANVVGGNLVKVVAWYDNEVGYAHRLVEMAEVFA